MTPRAGRARKQAGSPGGGAHRIESRLRGERLHPRLHDRYVADLGAGSRDWLARRFVETVSTFYAERTGAVAHPPGATSARRAITPKTGAITVVQEWTVFRLNSTRV
jgi:hypothetical protein